jgi:hypothetical protein
METLRMVCSDVAGSQEKSGIKCQVSGAKFMLTADPTPDT